MTGSDRADPGDAAAKKAAKDKARIDAVFGQTLPETTSDEARGSDSWIDDAWWHAQRPPHHG